MALKRQVHFQNGIALNITVGIPLRIVLALNNCEIRHIKDWKTCSVHDAKTNPFLSK